MDKSGHLQTNLSDSWIQRLAGDRYYQRGVDYFQRGLVRSLKRSGDAIEATVRGSQNYAVRLSSNGKKFEFSCECPIGEDGAFCKHCVATALAWLSGNAIPSTVQESSRAPRITTEDIKEALSAQDKETIIGWLMEWSERDATLRQKLTMIAALKNGSGALVAQVRGALKRAIKISGYCDYDQAPAYAARVESALEGIDTLLQQGHGAPVIDLCEAAMKWLEAATGNIDDSDGQVTELMGRVAELHLLACEQAKPDPESLAARLFALEKNGEYDQWSNAAGNYAHVLGENGLQAFRDEASKAWAKIPHRTVRESYRSGENHYGITRIMEALALQSGDVEQLVSVLERDLTSAHQYLRIAEAYRKAANHERALHWAERGMTTYAGHEGASLRLFVAEEYQRAERHADALRVIWTDFRNAPHLGSYQLLERFARAADDWEDWRDRALAHIRRAAAEESSASPNPQDAIRLWWNRNQGGSLLVEIFLYEQNIDEAWREAQTGGCRDELWIKLCMRREATHPADAIPVYLRLGEQAVTATTNGRYEPAIELFEKAAALLHSLGRSQEFVLQFETLRQRFRAKRNLQKLAEARRRFLYLR